MKPIYTAYVSLILLISCNEKQKNEEVKQQSNQVIAESFMEAYNNHDLKALRNLYSNDATISTVDFEGAKQVDSAIQKTYGDYFNGAPDLKAVVRKIIVNGNDIAISFACHGTITNIDKGDPGLKKFKPESMKNKTINIDVVSLFQVKDGKIIEEKTV